jgi:hypothetical protein
MRAPNCEVAETLSPVTEMLCDNIPRNDMLLLLSDLSQNNISFKGFTATKYNKMFSGLEKMTVCFV